MTTTEARAALAAQAPADRITQELAAWESEHPPTVKAPRPFARPLADILADLSKPIAPQHLKTKAKGGTKFSFLTWYYAVKYLDYYAPGWSSEVRNVTWFDSRIVVTVRLAIVAAEGVFYREATGTEEEPDDDEKMFGDPSSNAEAMAFKRAASKFGLGLSLYDKR